MCLVLYHALVIGESDTRIFKAAQNPMKEKNM